MDGWYFRPRQEGETIREPVHGEFFNQDAISEPGKALIREGIQNALDAGMANGNGPGTPVKVRIYLSEDKGALRPEEVIPFTQGAVKHLTAESNGLTRENSELTKKKCKFLVFEDFNTCGLTGDPGEAFKSKSGKENHFYHFFRAEGQSDKGQASRGSWGVGKHVFIRTSRVSTIFALTVRNDDRKRFLMGKCVLKSHYADNLYCQDGYYGIRNEKHLVLPEEDSRNIEEFITLFNLKRDSESGLSIVVLWPEEEISSQLLLKAILQDYFYPVLTGQLEVVVETPDTTFTVNAKSLSEELSSESFLETLEDKTDAEKLKSYVALAVWSRLCSRENIVDTVPQKWSGSWSRDMFYEEQFELLKSKYNNSEKIALEIPVMINKRNSDPVESRFHVYLMRVPNASAGRPVFIRDGIIISEVDAPLSRSVHALVIADDPEITDMLRRAENPSHTQWDHSRLKEGYMQGYKKSLLFIKRSVCELVRLITEADSKKDTTLLADLFPSPVMPEEEDHIKTSESEKGRDNGEETTPPVIPDDHEPRLQRLNIQKKDGGFSILPGNDPTILGKQISIRVAYDVRKGNSLKKYMPSDFNLNDLKVEAQNLNISQRENNNLVATVDADDFKLDITGFDLNRQIYVRTNVKEVDDDGSQI